MTLTEGGARRIPCAVLLPTGLPRGDGPLPVLMDPYGGPHGQRVRRRAQRAPRPRSGSPTRASRWSSPTAAAPRAAPPPGRRRSATTSPASPSTTRSTRCTRSPSDFPLDLARVGDPRLVLRRLPRRRSPCCAARTSSTRRSRARRSPTGGCTTPTTPSATSATRTSSRRCTRRNSLVADAGLVDAAEPHRPMMIIHGLADDNVVVAHSLRLSSALLAAGRPHEVLPLSGRDAHDPAGGGRGEPAAAPGRLPEALAGPRRVRHGRRRGKAAGGFGAACGDTPPGLGS